MVCGSLIVSPPDYKGGDWPGPVFKAGDVVTVRATGDPNGVPPFSQTIVAVPEIASITPAFGTYDLPTPISRSTDTVFSWSPAGPGTVTIELASSRPVAADTEVYVAKCEAPGIDGKLTLPKDLLSTYPAALHGGGIHARATSRKTFAAGKFNIELSYGKISSDDLNGTFELTD